MCRIKRFLCNLVVCAFMLSSMPAGAHVCLHDMQGMAKSAGETTADNLPPCHQQAAEQTTQNSDMSKSGTMDCCGDKCTCAAGTCSATTAFLTARQDSVFAGLSAVSYEPAAEDFHPFMPEQATPPPRA